MGGASTMIEFESLPELLEPVLVCAFEGWNDAGEAASGALTHLIHAWAAQPLAEMDSESYYDYQVNRPIIEVDSSGIRNLTWPATRIFIARLPLANRDIVLVQ